MADANPWIPLLSTIAGGAIGFLSAQAAARQQTAAMLRKEKLDRRLRKAEELYELVLKLEHVTASWAIAVAEANPQFLNPKLDFPEHEQKRIGLIAHLHLPEVKGAADRVLENRLKYGRRVGDCADLFAAGKQPDAELIGACRSTYQDLRASSAQLREAISHALNSQNA